MASSNQPQNLIASILSEQQFVVNLYDLPNWDSAQFSQKKEILKAKMTELLGFVPIIPLIIHLSIAVRLPSDCSYHNDTLVLVYLILLHLLTFMFEVVYYLPFNSSWGNKEFLSILLKSGVLTFNLFVFTLVRAKPYKCLVEYDQNFASVVFLIGVGISSVFAFKIDRMVTKREETTRKIDVPIEI